MMNDTDKQALLEQLQQGEVTVTFTKVNGESRVMTCTLNESVLPPKPETTTPRKSNPDVLSVWDTNAQGWRSFRWDSVTAINGE